MYRLQKWISGKQHGKHNTSATLRLENFFYLKVMYKKLFFYVRGCRRLVSSACLPDLKPRPCSLSAYNHAFTCNFITKASLCSNDLININNLQINVIRTYAKDKKKDKKKGSQKIDELELSETFELEELYAKFKKPIEVMKQEYIEQLTIRSAAGALDTLKVHHEGKDYMLQDLADIGKKNPRTYALDVTAFPGAIPSIVTAIQSSGLGLNPQQDGLKIYLPIPKVTKEHRESLAKNAKALFNKCKDSINEVKNAHIKYVQNNIKNADEAFRLSNQLTALGNKYVEEAEQMMKTKQADLLKSEN